MNEPQQGGLFDLPDAPAATAPLTEAELLNLGRPTYTAYKGAHKACGDHQALKHAEGGAGALPPARWVRRTKNATVYLCSVCVRARQATDGGGRRA